jgi:MFS family permease
MAAGAPLRRARAGEAESAYAWLRLSSAVLLGSLGSVGLWAYVVTLPAVQASFGATRAEASLPYTLAMAGFAVGTAAVGPMVDRWGIVRPLSWTCLLLALGFLASGLAANLRLFAFAEFAIGLGSAGTFAPLIADISHWFTRHRAIAVALCASGNYLGGTLWPPLVQWLAQRVGWRHTQMAIGVACVLAVPLLLAMRRRLARPEAETPATATQASALGLHRLAAFALLCLAGFACCVAMSMPQVHIVAYCGDLGYGAARGAEMLSLMLFFGLLSRIGSGFAADRIGGLATLLLGSLAQCAALILYLLFDGLAPLYTISALFGLFQGGIVPMYAVIIREHFPQRQAAALVGFAITATILGMGVGGWLSGAIFDLTSSYRLAFANGVAWNALNAAIVLFLLLRRARHRPAR